MGHLAGNEAMARRLKRSPNRISKPSVEDINFSASPPLNEQEGRDFLEICDAGYNRRSTILTNQLPTEK